MNIVEEVTNGKAQLLDVRTKDEWRDGHAEGAIHISLNNLTQNGADKLDPNKPVYVYCASGGRSGTAQAYLRAAGFDATNIGGLGNWAASGGKITK